MAGSDEWGGWGGYMKSKKQKLVDQFEEADTGTEARTRIFQGITIHVNGYTDPSADVLKRLMKTHGGVFSLYPGHHITHHIVSQLAHSKIQSLGAKDKYCTANWITDSIAAGKLLPDEDYRIYKKETRNGSKSLVQFLERKPSADIPPTAEDDAETSTSRDEAHPAPAISAKDPDFLQQFYSRSRLHFISTLAQEMKDLVRRMKREAEGRFPGREELSRRGTDSLWTPEKVFMHLDMDCFFVSVAIRGRAELAGKAVAVTHSKGKREDASSSWSEVASCSYEARGSGVRNGMLLGEAFKRCPGLVPVPYDFQGYHSVSHTLYQTVARYTLTVEAVSCDEIYVDLTEVCEETKCGPLEVASVIREEIRTKTGCPASAGLGPNMLVARLATKKAKPNGQCYISGGERAEFMKGQKVEDLPGVGRKTREKLAELNVSNCKELAELPLSVLCSELGPNAGKQLRDSALGIDSRQMKEEALRKSVSCDVNYGIRFTELWEAQEFLTRLCGELAQRLADSQLVGQHLTLKLMVRSDSAPVETKKFMGHGICDSLSKSTQLPAPTGDKDVITREIMSLLRQINPRVKDLRGIGMSMQKLTPSGRQEKAESGGIKRFIKTRSSTHFPVHGEGEEGVPLKRRRSERAPNEHYPQSLSQIDESVLKALPDEIRTEVQYQCKSVRRGLFSPQKRPPTSNRVETLEDQQEGGVDVGGSEVDEAFRCPRSPPNKQQLIHGWFKRAECTHTCESERKRRALSLIPQEMELFGARTLEEVKEALRDRILSSRDAAEDGEKISDYLCYLIMRKHQLRSVQILLRLLHRFINRGNLSDWMQEYSSILKKVEAVIQEKYCATLEGIPRF